MKFALSRTDLEALARELQNGLNNLSLEENVLSEAYRSDWHPIVVSDTGTFTQSNLFAAKYCLNGNGKRTDIGLKVAGTVGAATPQSFSITLPDGVIGSNEGLPIFGWGKTNTTTPIALVAFIERTTMRLYRTDLGTFTGVLDLRLNGSFERV